MILNNLGEFYRQQDSYAKAVPYYKRAIDIYEDLEGKERSFDLATSLSNLGIAYYYLGRHKEAEALLLRSIAIEENVLGFDHPRLAQGLNNLALIRTGQAKYGEAISLYERALSIWKESLGPYHTEMARGFDNLGKTYHLLGKYSEAEPLFIQSVTIMEKVFGRYHKETLESLTDLWALYYEQKKYSEAEPYFDRTLQALGWTNKAEYREIAGSLISDSINYRRNHLIFEARKWEAFAKELQRQYKLHSRDLFGVINVGKKKIGRNEPCPCGSGNKYKKCCGV